MNIKFNNVYVNECAIFTGPYEKRSKYSKYFDKSYDDYYFGEKTYEQGEIKLLKEVINSFKTKPDILLMSDLSNELAVSSKVASTFDIPYLGLYSACSSSAEGIIVASNLIESGNVKNALITSSSHNLTAERQFRYPVEYGALKHKTATFTTTAATAISLTSNKTNIKIESVTIGTPLDSGSINASHMGEVMSIGAIDTIFKHLKETSREYSYYDIILTGDLGIYGMQTVKDYAKEVYRVTLDNYNDCGVMLYERDKEVLAGGSGVSCAPCIMYGYIYNMMKEKKYKKVLYVPTGSLHNTTLVNQKLTIPTISHAVSFEVVL